MASMGFANVLGARLSADAMCIAPGERAGECLPDVAGAENADVSRSRARLDDDLEGQA
jgi:hypothetical protein